MNGPEFIIKQKKSTAEYLCFSTIAMQQATSEDKLILTSFDKDKLGIENAKPILLFMRVGNVDEGLYTRFRANIWYQTDNYSLEALRIYIKDYKEFRSVWEWLEKRINPLAVAIATIVATAVTFVGVNLSTYLNGNKQELKIQELEKQLATLQKALTPKEIKNTSK